MKVRTIAAVAALAALGATAPAAHAGPFAPAVAYAEPADAAFLRLVDGWGARFTRAWSRYHRCPARAHTCNEDRIDILRGTGRDGSYAIRSALKWGSSPRWEKPADPCVRRLGQLVAFSMNTWRGVYFSALFPNYRTANIAYERTITTWTRAIRQAQGCVAVR